MLAALVGLAAVVVVAGRRSHTTLLLQTVPADRSTVAAVPARVTLVFDKPALALGTTIEVQGPHGPEAVGQAVLLNATVSENIRAGAPAEAYLVRWRVTSADGHPISGSFAFTARTAGGGTLTVAPPAPPRDRDRQLRLDPARLGPDLARFRHRNRGADSATTARTAKGGRARWVTSTRG